MIGSRDTFLGVAIGVSPLVLWALASHAWVRLAIVVLGGIFVLGSSSEVSALKLVYSGLLVLCSLVSGFRLLRNSPIWIRPFRALVGPGLLLSGVLIVSFFASPDGADVTTFARQAIFYLMLLAAPIVGLDSGRDLSPANVYKIVWLVGLIAAVGFATDWLARRNVSSLELGKFVLASSILPGFAFGLALILLTTASGFLRKLPWLTLVILIPIAMLVTGTRSNLIIFVAAFAIIGALRNKRVPLKRLAVSLSSIAVIGATLFPIVASAVISQPGFIENRIQALLSVASGDSANDQSLSGRQLQYELALQIIGRQPLFGQGLGYEIPFTLDTPLLTVVRLGIVGSLVLIAYIVVIALAFRKARLLNGPSVTYTAWWGFVAIAVATIPFGTPFEDRGFGFTILLIFVGVGSELQAMQPRSDSRTSGGQFVPLVSQLGP